MTAGEAIRALCAGDGLNRPFQPGRAERRQASGSGLSGAFIILDRSAQPGDGHAVRGALDRPGRRRAHAEQLRR